MYRILIVTSLVFLALVVRSQDIGLMGFGNDIQKTYISPASKLDKKFNIAAGGLQFQLATNGPTINQLTSKNSLGKRYIDLDNWQKSIQDQNNIDFSTEIRTIDVGLKIGTWGFLAGHAFKNQGGVSYTRDLTELLSKGNADFIGQTLDVGPGMDFTSYNELYLGVQKQFGNLSLGIKSKLLFGVGNVHSENSSLSLTTQEEFYQLSIESDYLINSSSIFDYTDLNDISFDYKSFSFDHFFYNNRGFAFDLGVSYELDEKLSLFASAIDIGSITWDFAPRNYNSNGTFVFDGIDIAEYLGDTTGVFLEDSLYQLLQFDLTRNAYSTRLNSRFFLGASYMYNEKWSLNALLRFDDSFLSNSTQLSLSGVKKFKYLEAGLSYTVRNSSFYNFGAMVKAKVGPFFGYLSTDNILAAVSLFDQRLANVRGGLVVAF